MSSKFTTLVTISAKESAEFQLPVVMGNGDGTRKTMQFTVMTPDGQLGVYGTFDEILDFAAAIMGRMFSWPLLNGEQNWFGEDDMQIIEKAVSDARQRNGSNAGERGHDRGTGEREGQPGPSAA